MNKMNIVDIHSDTFSLFESVPVLYVVSESCIVPSQVTTVKDLAQNFLHGYIRVGTELERGLLLARLVEFYQR